jgi:hypothetical protein
VTTHQPVTNAEWHYLERRFVALERLPGMRELFDESLPGSPYTPTERRHARREIFEAVRSLMAPTEAFPNPFFELTWFRAVKANPGLNDNPTQNRSLLWNAFFQPVEPPNFREQQVNMWKAVAGDETGLPIVTDRELEEASD